MNTAYSTIDGYSWTLSTALSSGSLTQGRVGAASWATGVTDWTKCIPLTALSGYIVFGGWPGSSTCSAAACTTMHRIDFNAATVRWTQLSGGTAPSMRYFASTGTVLDTFNNKSVLSAQMGRWAAGKLHRTLTPSMAFCDCSWYYLCAGIRIDGTVLSDCSRTMVVGTTTNWQALPGTSNRNFPCQSRARASDFSPASACRSKRKLKRSSIGRLIRCLFVPSCPNPSGHVLGHHY